MAQNRGKPCDPARKPREPGIRQLHQPKGRVTIKTLADVIRRVDGLSLTAKDKMCGELAVAQPEALGWVLLLARQGVSMEVVDIVLHQLLVVCESVRITLGRPVPRITMDMFEKASAKTGAMLRLLQGESKAERARLIYLMAEAHPERNLFAYVVGFFQKKAAGGLKAGDEKAIFVIETLLEAFTQAVELAQTPE